MNEKAPTNVNPCCGVKLKVAVVVIGFVDIAYGLLFVIYGVLLYSSEEIPKAFVTGLELINLLGRPPLKLVVGMILVFSAKYRLKCNGQLSICGCVAWILGQGALFGLTVMRFLNYMEDWAGEGDKYLLKKSGASTLESFALFNSLAPFPSVGVLWYEIVTVIFFTIKLFQDQRILQATAIALEVALNERGTNNLYSLSQSPTNKSKNPVGAGLESGEEAHGTGAESPGVRPRKQSGKT